MDVRGNVFPSPSLFLLALLTHRIVVSLAPQMAVFYEVVVPRNYEP